MNSIEEAILRAVVAGKVTKGTVILARRVIATHDALAARPAPKALVHHSKERRAEEKEREAVSEACWVVCLIRVRIDHRGRLACEGCHHEKPLAPHHLILGDRTDAPELVMALCADCHRLDPKSAHRAPRHFAQTVVVPWLAAHNYPIPNRKEYR